MKKATILKWIFLALTIAVNVFIIVNAATNGATSAEESGRFSHFMASVVNAFYPNFVTEANFDSFAYMIRKLFGHFGLFVLNGLVSTVTAFLFLKDTKLNKNYFVFSIALVFGLVIAMVSELIQIFTPDRYGSWGDIGIDFGGFVLGNVLIFAVLYFFDFINLKEAQK